MQKITLDIEAGQLSAELSRRGIPADLRVHVVVDIPDETDLSMTEMVEAGRGFEWLADEPNLYSDADLIGRAA